MMISNTIYHPLLYYSIICSNVHVSFCGHGMHKRCFHTYFESIGRLLYTTIIIIIILTTIPIDIIVI